MLIVVNGLFQNTNRVVSISQVLIKNVIMPVPQASFQKGNAFRVPSEVVQCGGFVDIESEGQGVAL
jgi:hypothetical protein